MESFMCIEETDKLHPSALSGDGPCKKKLKLSQKKVTTSQSNIEKADFSLCALRNALDVINDAIADISADKSNAANIRAALQRVQSGVQVQVQLALQDL
jgi:hypothetical protein